MWVAPYRAPSWRARPAPQPGRADHRLLAPKRRTRWALRCKAPTPPKACDLCERPQTWLGSPETGGSRPSRPQRSGGWRPGTVTSAVRWPALVLSSRRGIEAVTGQTSGCRYVGCSGYSHRSATITQLPFCMARSMPREPHLHCRSNQTPRTTSPQPWGNSALRWATTSSRLRSPPASP